MLGETTPGSRHAKPKSAVRESLAYCSIRFYTILIHKTSVLGEAKSSHSLCGETYRKGQMEITLYLRVPTQLSRTALANLLSYSLELLFQNFPLLKTLYQPILSLSTNELSSSERNIEATRQKLLLPNFLFQTYHHMSPLKQRRDSFLKASYSTSLLNSSPRNLSEKLFYPFLSVYSIQFQPLLVHLMSTYTHFNVTVFS